MSSERKDARWQLAYQICDLLDRRWDDMQYREHNVLLDAADDILTHPMFEHLIPEFSERWRNGE